VLSDDTATTDRVDKLIEYAALPSLRAYVLVEQTAVAATLFQREPGGVWIASAHTEGVLALPGLDLALPLADLYRGAELPGLGAKWRGRLRPGFGWRGSLMSGGDFPGANAADHGAVLYELALPPWSVLKDCLACGRLSAPVAGQAAGQ